MATRSIDIAVTVRDKATRPLRGVEKQVKRTGRAAKQSAVDFTELNRSLFATSAFVGTFAFAFNRLGAAMDEAAKTDRIMSNFEKTLGPKGEFISQLQQMTDRSVDLFEAMEKGIELRSLGIVNSTKQMAEISAMASAQAANIGKTSTEGIRAFSQFLKDGSISHLQFLGLIQQANTSLKLSESIIGKYGGVMSSAMTTSQRLAMGLDLLRKKTEGTLKGQRDYADILQDVQIFSRMAMHDVKMLAVAAFAPLLDKVRDISIAISSFAERVRKTDKEILFLIKTVGLTTVAVGGLVAVVGTLRLAVLALGSVGVGIPMLTGTLGALAVVFLGLTHDAKTFTEKLKVFGAVFKGTFQLVRSFLSDPENFAKGIGKIDKSLADLLRKHGLLDFVSQMSRAIAVSAKFAQGVGQGFAEAFNQVVKYIGKTTKTLFQLLGMDTGPWARGILDSAKSIGRVIGKTTVAVLGLVAAFKLLKGVAGVAGGISGLVGKISSVFKGTGTTGPTGRATDPLFVRMLNTMLGTPETTNGKGRAGKAGKTTGAVAAASPMNTVRRILRTVGRGLLTGIKGLFSGLKFAIVSILNPFTAFGKGVRGLVSVFRAAVPLVARFAPLLLAAAVPLAAPLAKIALIAGTVYTAFKILEPIIKEISGRTDEFKDVLYDGYVKLRRGFEDLVLYFKRLGSDLSDAFDMVYDYVADAISDAGSWIRDSLYKVGNTIADTATDIYNNLLDIPVLGDLISSTISVFGSIADMVGIAYDKVSKFVTEKLNVAKDFVDKVLEKDKPVSQRNFVGQMAYGASEIGSAVASGTKGLYNLLAGTDEQKAATAKSLVDKGLEVTGALTNTSTLEGTARIADQINRGMMPANYELDRGSIQSQEKLMAELKGVSSQVEGDKQARFVAAMKAAQSEMSQSGQVITPEEYRNIFEYALSKSNKEMLEVQKKVADNTTPKSETTTTKVSRGGGC